MSEYYVKVGKKYVIVIPSEVRKAMKIKEGDILKVRLEGKRILIEKTEDPFKILADIIGEEYIEEIDEKRAEKWLKKNAGS